MSKTEVMAPGAEVRYFPSALNPHLTVAEVVDGYLQDYAGKDTSRNQRLGFWRAELGDVPAVALTPIMLKAALRKLKQTDKHRFAGRDPDTDKPVMVPDGKRASSTINRYRMALSAALHWAHKEGLLPDEWINPCKRVDTEQEPEGRVRFLSDDERERLLTACRVSSWRGFYLYILFLLLTGCRKSEALWLRVKDVDLTAGTATLLTSKNKKPRVMPLTPALVAEFKRQGFKPEDKDDESKMNQLVFAAERRETRAAGRPRAVNGLWVKALRRAKIQDFRMHDLRHSTASYLAQNGAGLLEIADVLGHRSLKMAARYSHLTVKHKTALIERVLGHIGTDKKAA